MSSIQLPMTWDISAHLQSLRTHLLQAWLFRWIVSCFLFPLSHVEKLGFLTPKERGVMFPRQVLGSLVNLVPRLFRVPLSWKFWQKVSSGRKGDDYLDMVNLFPAWYCRSSTSCRRVVFFSANIRFFSFCNKPRRSLEGCLTWHSGSHHLSPGHCFFLD